MKVGKNQWFHFIVFMIFIKDDLVFHFVLLQSRPYGVALLIAGVDTVLDPETKEPHFIPQLYHTDPTGTYESVEYKAIGGAAEPASAKLNEEYFKVSHFNF